MKTTIDTIKEIERYYTIYPNGGVRSIRTGRLMKPSITIQSAPMYNLSTDRSLQISVARLLALKYIPNPNNYTDVEHLDGNRMNNNIDNLGWCRRNKNYHKCLTDKIWREHDQMTEELSLMLTNDARVKKVCVNGVGYGSVEEACVSLGICRRTFNRRYNSLCSVDSI